MKHTYLLETALRSKFRNPKPTHLARLLELSLSSDTICYEHIDLPGDEKHECILAAFEERMLIPAKTGISPAWEDWVLSLCPGEVYFMPPVVRCFIENTLETGNFDPKSAVTRSLGQHAEGHIDELVRFFLELRHHAASYTLEVGLMEAIKRKIAVAIDLHYAIGCFVVLGIISPCTRSPMALSLSWYEVNPCLYWNS